MDRRRFLKYAGAGAVVIGASGLGLDYLLSTSNRPSMTVSSTEMLTSSSTTTTSSSTKLVTLSGRLFLDYDGDGAQSVEDVDNGPSAKDLPISNAKVQLRDQGSPKVMETASDSNGHYSLEDIPTGHYKLYPMVDQQFRYMCLSAKDLAEVAVGLNVSISETQEIDIGFMEGFLTLPFGQGTPISVGAFVDIDRAPGRWMDWGGGKRTYDGHSGTDFLVDGVPVLAAAPGTVTDMRPDPNGGRSVLLSHEVGYTTFYSHLASVDVYESQVLARGDKIGISGAATTCRTPSGGYVSCYSPHLHFELDRGNYYVDPYKSMVPSLGSPESYWTKTNNPQYP